jgi:tetratricopeptide (TPR) repeat protein
MVYSMDVEQQVHRARADRVRQGGRRRRADAQQAAQIGRTGPGRGAAGGRRRGHGQRHGAPGAHRALRFPGIAADRARANFILARAAILTGHPEQAIDGFQKTLATSKDPRLLSWSHIYLGRMLDLDCKRDEAVAEYKEALKTRDGQQDTRLAAERGVKAAYAVNGHSCDDDAEDDARLRAVPAAAGEDGRLRAKRE